MIALVAGFAFTLGSAAAVAPELSSFDDHASGVVALKAGTVMLVEGGKVLENATVLVRDGKIASVGQDVAIPADAEVIDYGSAAVIAPGLVCADSNFGIGSGSARTADLGVLAIDNFDPYSTHKRDLAAGVTTVYIPPARGRLIAGQGAVVKLAGEAVEDRILRERSAIHGSITNEARRTRGYWVPPVPATADVGLGVEQPQLPRTTMGAIVALEELVQAARGGVDNGEYGPNAASSIAEAMEASMPWRLGADSASEIRALLGFFAANELPLVLDGAREAGGLADEIAKAKASVIFRVDAAPNQRGLDRGKGENVVWPVYDAVARLVEKGVPVAIAPSIFLRPADLRFVASLASRGGLAPEAALHAITLGAAEVLGVADRVGSITPGKDADLVVFNGSPLEISSSVVATFVSGASTWTAAGSRARAAAVVLSVDELHVGDGRVMQPAEILMLDGKIAEIGPTVSHPTGAAIVRGKVAMPGMVDAFGHLGLEGSDKSPNPDFRLRQLLEPGDRTDRRVARAGVTSVVMAPRQAGKSGAPMMAYKPAEQSIDEMLIADPIGLRLKWTEENRTKSGEDVRELLEKAAEYQQEWDEYEAALAAWKPEEQAPEPEKKKDDDEDEKDDDKGDDEEEDEKSGKKKGDKDKQDEGDPVHGIWECAAMEGRAKARLRIEHKDGSVTGSLRCDSVSKVLVQLEGTFADGKLEASGLGSGGFVRVEGELDDDKLSGTIECDGETVEIECERTSRELKYARRTLRRHDIDKKDGEEDEPKKSKKKGGPPKEPSTDEKLEPLRRAMKGEAAIVVTVDREDEILDCVEAFNALGIKPILYGAGGILKVAERVRGRVMGILPDHPVLGGDYREGLRGVKNRYAELDAAGLRVAFHSQAEEGATDLPVKAAYAVSLGMSPASAMRAVTSGVADMLGISGRVGRLQVGLDADVLLLDGAPMLPSTSVVKAWVNGHEVK